MGGREMARGCCVRVSGSVSLLQSALHERESVHVEKIAEMVRETGVSIQVVKKGNGGFFQAFENAEQEVFMFEQALLP
jgi:hypothetical protein